MKRDPIAVSFSTHVQVMRIVESDPVIFKILINSVSFCYVGTAIWVFFKFVSLVTKIFVLMVKLDILKFYEA
ncbi:hypothetical protein Fmac_029246 [Flemingia macrophylla]|uniref:Transmembrane protein n=1 Tax=Flemingia macrophylla TaxID=520843 RepID=A0ABD1L9S0_9FABA